MFVQLCYIMWHGGVKEGIGLNTRSVPVVVKSRLLSHHQGELEQTISLKAWGIKGTWWRLGRWQYDDVFLKALPHSLAGIRVFMCVRSCSHFFNQWLKIQKFEALPKLAHLKWFCSKKRGANSTNWYNTRNAKQTVGNKIIFYFFLRSLNLQRLTNIGFD